MIYIIDDKRSRQRDYGWDESKLYEYRDILKPIYNFEDLSKNLDSIFMYDNIILFHESFLASNDNNKIEEIESFKKALENNSSNIYTVYFSGSKNSRYVEERNCMLQPDVMYANLDMFINKMKDGDINLNFLAYGSNFSIEEEIRNKLEKVNNQNVGGEKIHIDKEIFFVATTDDTVLPPFKNISQTEDYWDSFDKDVTDEDLDNIINQYLQNKKFDTIYIPLYFGSSYSDYLGLRLAMHIRLTESPNRYTPIFIYGVSSHEELLNNSCYDILKFTSVFLINADNESFIESTKKSFSEHENYDDIDKFEIKIPDNIGDNHSVANKWAMYRWVDMLKWNKDNIPQLLDTDFKKSLYFKYLDAKHGKHDRFRDDKKYSIEISGLQNKKIAYIDDEYDKGWEEILKTLFDQNGAHFLCYKGFDKKLSKDALIEKIKAFIVENEADCYILDLRLHEDDLGKRNDLSGHKVSEFIKEQNLGNQIVIFTASNKIWNLKEEIDNIGANAYTLKESPELNLKRDDSLDLYKDFIKSVKLACSMSYLKDIVNKQKELKELMPQTAQLDSLVNLLLKNAGQNDQELLGVAVLTELVFIEDLIKNQFEYELIESDRKIFYRHQLNKPKIITGHLFFKSEFVNGHKVVIDFDYKENVSLRENDWDDVIKKDITLIVAVLILELKIPRTIVKKYVDFKYIRNTQIAHGGKKTIKLREEMIVDFYNDVVYPIVIKISKNI